MTDFWKLIHCDTYLAMTAPFHHFLFTEAALLQRQALIASGELNNSSPKQTRIPCDMLIFFIIAIFTVK